VQAEAARELAAVLTTLATLDREPRVGLCALAQAGAQRTRFGQSLDQHVFRTGDRLCRLRDAVLLAPERERPEIERLTGKGRVDSVAAVPDPVRERAETGLTCRRRG
jgi:hypothetical protein